MNNRAVTGVVTLVVAALVWAWALGWFDGKKYSDDPEVAELERLRDENLPKIEKMPEEQRRAERDVFRERMKGLSEEQRMKFFESSAPIFIPLFAKAFEKRYDEFMAKSAEEQRKELDKEIDRMQANQNRPGGPGGPGGGGRPNIDPKKADEFRKKMLDWTTPEQRAKFENGIRIFNQRREERGLSPIPPPGRGAGIF
jgi:hypothetical protein